MDESFIRNRITQLRLQKNLSEREISLALGHSSSYIHSIVNGKGLPSMKEFLALCEFFQTEPSDFFNTNVENPSKFNGIIEKLEKLSDTDLSMIEPIIDRFSEKK